MIKKMLYGGLLLVVILCGGCWNYRGLNEMTIVSGFAIDRGQGSNLFKVSFQVVDLYGNVKVEGINGKLLEAQGKTLFDACRNAKQYIVGKLYFGHMQLVVLSDDLVRHMDLLSIINLQMKDAETRETLKLVISAGDTAKEILNHETLVGSTAAFDVSEYIEADNRATASTSYKQLYEVYSTLKSEGIDLTLPAVINVDNNGEYIAKLCGTAVFKGERLVGYLSPEESKYFLFAVGEIEGGLINFPADGQGRDDITLEIHENKTKRSFAIEDGKLVIKVETKTDVYLAECGVPINPMDKQQIAALEQTAAQTLADRMAAVIKKVQSEYGADIFGFGNMIYKKDNPLWNTIKSDWDTMFPELNVVVKAKINIVNSAYIKE